MVNLINIMSKRLHDKTFPSKTHFTKKEKEKRENLWILLTNIKILTNRIEFHVLFTWWY